MLITLKHLHFKDEHPLNAKEQKMSRLAVNPRLDQFHFYTALKATFHEPISISWLLPFIFSSMNLKITLRRGNVASNVVAQQCRTLCNPMDCILPVSSVHGDSPGKNTGVGCHCLLQEIILTQGSNAGLLHCRQPQSTRVLQHFIIHFGFYTICDFAAYVGYFATHINLEVDCRIP